jgi:hypothetical protein
MNARKLGVSLIVVGAAVLTATIAIDWFRYDDDDTLARSEGIFDFGVATHVVFFAGLCLVALGGLVLVVGRRLVSTSNVGLKAAALLAAVGLVAGTAAVAGASKYADGAGADHHGDDAGGMDHHADDAGGMDHHGDDAGGMDHHGDDAGAMDHHADDAGAMDHHADDAGATDHHSMDDGDGVVDPGEVITATADGTSPCEIAQPAPASPGQAGAGTGGQEGQAAGEHGHRGLVKPYPLTDAEQLTLIEQMRAARTVIDKFPTVADAEAAGYKKSTVFVPCIGAHYTNISLIAKFDPAAPSELLFDGTDPESRIIGLSYLVLDPKGAPEGFAGKNDLWHQHNANGGLCLNGAGTVVGGEDVSEEECTRRGGRKAGDVMEHIWMVHAWVAPGWECSWGVFAGECPELGGKLGGTAWD